MTDPQSPNKTIGWILSTGLGAAAAFTGTVHAASWITPTGEAYAWNPVTLLADLIGGTAWPPCTALIGGLVLAGAAAAGWFLMPKARTRHRTDKASKHMGQPAETRVLREPARRQEAQVLHPQAAERIGPGQLIGSMVGQPGTLFQGWRDLAVHVWGTGRGKTSSMVIPHLAAAPGPAALTGNKVDGVPETIAARQDVGQIWLFDPQRIYRDSDEPAFVFNPLTDVRTLTDAKQLAAIFEASTKDPDSRGGDAQFDTQGRNLLAAFLLAAALDGRPLSEVFEWLVDEQGRGEEPRAILEQRRQKGPARLIRGVMGQPVKTAGGVYATAQRMAECLQDDDLLAWTEPRPGTPVFSPAAFVQSTDTLILLSQEGEGSAGAILTALIKAVCTSGERLARRNRGRMPVPMVMELDECANIVRWPELPRVYSYYGSLGIQLSAYFQSRAQAVGVFGEHGWRALWNGASVRSYGGGSDDVPWLKELSAVIGERDEVITNTSRARGSTTYSTTTRKVPVLPVEDLAALPEWRAVVFSSKARPVQVAVTPWFQHPTLQPRISARLPQEQPA